MSFMVLGTPLLDFFAVLLDLPVFHVFLKMENIPLNLVQFSSK